MLRPQLPSSLPTNCLRQASVTRCMRHIRPQVSFLHSNIIPRPDKPRVPLPRPDIPDVQTFLKRIGRDAHKECEDKIRTWRELFNADGEALKKKEIPARLRRYVLMQTEKYRNGEEIVHIRRGKKVGGGERRREKVPSKTKIGR